MLPAWSTIAQLDANAAPDIRDAAQTAPARTNETRLIPVSRNLAPTSDTSNNQLVQLSVAGLVVEVAAPPVAVTPVKDGIEKYVFSQAAGVADSMLASLVKVTTSGSFA